MPRASSAERLLHRRFLALGRSLPGAQKGDVAGVHRARVASRRLREALPLVSTDRTARRLRKVVRRLTRALGAVRELDVALMTLTHLQNGRDVPREGVRQLRTVIAEERRRLGAALDRLVAQCDFDDLRHKALAAVRKSKRGRRVQAGGAGDPGRLAAGWARAGARAASLSGAMENAAGIYLPDRLHQVRIAAKKLRYAVEILGELGWSGADAPVRSLRNAQDLLGRMHDFDVLIMRIRALQGSDRAPTLKASAQLDQLVRRLETECRLLHVRYVEAARELRTLCDRVMARADRYSSAA
jgi:CHAD domain-containing protein